MDFVSELGMILFSNSQIFKFSNLIQVLRLKGGGLKAEGHAVMRYASCGLVPN
jgi:hypothetical protein